MLQALFLLLLLAVVLGGWYWSVTGREKVLAISDEICRELKIQRLDDSVALCGVRVLRDPTLGLERRYEFEFSTDGLDRCRGQIVLQGTILQRARLELPDGPLLLDIGSRT